MLCIWNLYFVGGPFFLNTIVHLSSGLNTKHFCSTFLLRRHDVLLIAIRPSDGNLAVPLVLIYMSRLCDGFASSLPFIIIIPHRTHLHYKNNCTENQSRIYILRRSRPVTIMRSPPHLEDTQYH